MDGLVIFKTLPLGRFCIVVFKLLVLLTEMQLVVKNKLLVYDENKV
jgi:hypothetical protein